jgi:ABC-type uncharacterized transport system substrate-binding protein
VDQLPELAAELVRMNVDIIFAPASTFVEPARQATKTIPIVFANHADPLGTGHVATLARPGGNITGLSVLMTDLAAKNLEILKEALPQITRIGVLWNPTTPSHVPALKSVEAGAEKLGIELRMVPARTIEDFDGAYATMTQEHVGGFLVLGGPSSYAENGVRLAELALKYRLPGIFWFKENAEAGGLMSYSADMLDLYRRSAVYIDKILKGAKPADLPVEQASKYERRPTQLSFLHKAHFCDRHHIASAMAQLFRADPEMIRRRPIQRYHCSLCAGLIRTRSGLGIRENPSVRLFRQGAGELWEPRSHREVRAPGQPGRRALRTW